ncbi:MAG: dTDP-4-dehydrorhamnose 3,5-epimerase [Fibrobacteres bacterium]|jgi:dTDP-4-dehydrorhamnose 3,5-epimerase|nr:dTDP-4-dehydrorhamnose 3,5-epimerase [Fibrobacterota bacterium]
MNVIPGGLEGLLVIEPKVFRDERGFFLEPYNTARYQASGIDAEFVQDNHSFSTRGVLRGLHFQTVPGQAKLLRCGRGKIWDVAVDIRPASSTFGQWWGLELDSESHRQLFIPVGFAHGFCVLSDEAEVLYKCSAVYNPATESGIAWNDPDIKVGWPIADAIVSARDQTNQSFAQYRAALGV